MKSLVRRAGLLTVAAAVGLIVTLVPARADTPYHGVHYTHKTGQASLLGILPEPTLDIAGVTFSSNGHYLHFSMDLPRGTQTPPLLMQQTDYIWRFSYGKPSVQYLVELSYFSHFGVIFPDYVGVTVNGADSTTPCMTCYAAINQATHRADFFATLEDFNTNALASASTAGVKPSPAPAKVGTVFKLIEADTQAETGGGSAVLTPGPLAFVTDTAPAPKGSTLKV